METEIIKTSDPNVVIKSVTTVEEINIAFLNEDKEGCLTRIAEAEDTIKRLQVQVTEFPEEIKEIIYKKIADIMACSELDKARIIYINSQIA